MILQLRPTLTALAVAVLSLTYFDHFSVLSMAGCAAGLGLTLAAILAPDRRCQVSPRWAPGLIVTAALVLVAITGTYITGEQTRGVIVIAVAGMVVFLSYRGEWRAHSLTAALLAGLAVLLTGTAVFRNWLAFAERPGFFPLVRHLGMAGFVGTVVCIFLARNPKRWAWRLRLAVLMLFLTGAAMRHAIVLASPDPLIDVYGWLRDAPGYLLKGVNPYAAAYDCCYTTERAKRLGAYLEHADPHPMTYPPLPILLALPLRAAHLDVRYANVWCDIAAALVLFAIAWRRGDPLAAVAIAGIWLNLPDAAYLLENAWYEPMMAAMLGVGLLLVERGSRGGGIFLGLGVTAKQFGLPMLLPLLKAHRARWRSLFPSMAAVPAIVTLPFLLWDPGWFIRVVISGHLGRPLDFTTNTFPSACYHVFGWAAPQVLWWALAGLLILLIAWRTCEPGAVAGLGMGAALLTFLMCNSISHINYLYLVEYLLLLGVAATVPQTAEAACEHDKGHSTVRLNDDLASLRGSVARVA